MKKLCIVTFLLVLTIFQAQNKRFFYDYKYIPDSNNKSDVKTEMMVLDIDDSGSKFYSYAVYQADSLVNVDLQKQLAATGRIEIKTDMKKSGNRFIVSKKYPEYKVFFHSRLLADSYKVFEERKINWKVSNEKQKIGTWNTQKAEADFAGRHWVAWFSDEIPIQDGPYKFHGLPGMIVQIEDDTKSHIFTLQGIKTINEIPQNVFPSKEITINQKQYDKLVKDYEKNPTKGFKQMQIGNISLQMADGSNQHMKEQENRIKEAIKKDNNRIELSIK